MNVNSLSGRLARPARTVLGAGLAAVCWIALGATGEEAFLTENHAAMDRMMAGMDLRPSGDIDRDFVAMMTPHHQGAIDMAVAELRHGRNEQLRRIAQEIIVEQQQEIAAMRLALGEPPPPVAAVPTQAAVPAPCVPSSTPAPSPQHPPHDHAAH